MKAGQRRRAGVSIPCLGGMRSACCERTPPSSSHVRAVPRIRRRCSCCLFRAVDFTGFHLISIMDRTIPVPRGQLMRQAWYSAIALKLINVTSLIRSIFVPRLSVTTIQDYGPCTDGQSGRGASAVASAGETDRPKLRIRFSATPPVTRRAASRGDRNMLCSIRYAV